MRIFVPKLGVLALLMLLPWSALGTTAESEAEADFHLLFRSAKKHVLMRFSSHSGEIFKALGHGQKILAIDPLREDVHRQLMHLHMQKGQRSLAVRQYRTCQETLQTELGIPPMPETQALFHQIMEADTPVRSSSLPPSWEIDQAVEKLHAAMKNVSCAQKNLEQALEQFRKTASK